MALHNARHITQNIKLCPCHSYSSYFILPSVKSSYIRTVQTQKTYTQQHNSSLAFREDTWQGKSLQQGNGQSMTGPWHRQDEFFAKDTTCQWSSWCQAYRKPNRTLWHWHQNKPESTQYNTFIINESTTQQKQKYNIKFNSDLQGAIKKFCNSVWQNKCKQILVITNVTYT